VRIALLIDSAPDAPYHAATVQALGHAADALGLAIGIVALHTDLPSLRSEIDTAAGVVIGPGSPYRDEHAVWDAVRTARERGLPLVGT